MIKKNLKKIIPASFDKVDSSRELETTRVYETLSKLMPKTMLDFEVHLVDHCNLNCASCSHFCPVAKPSFLSVEEYEKDVKRLSSLFNKKANFIRLMGGEPLLHPKIHEFMKITRKYFPDALIDLDTNGILLSKMNDNFYKIVSSNNINITVTKYPIDINIDEVLKKCKEFNCNFRYFDNNGERLFTLFPLDLEGRENIELNFLKCFLANSCHTLKHGKMYTCSTIGHVDAFNKYFKKDLKVCDDDYIDIYRVKNKDEILEFLSKPVPFCRYCNVNSRIVGNKWKKSSKDIKEWII